MREIILDTETTGLDPKQDRIVEIGCVELIHKIPTRKTYQKYINPQQMIHPRAVEVHGLTSEFLEQHPVFEEVVDSFLQFIGDATLVIHNAPFDLGFLQAEVEKAGRTWDTERNVVDTLEIAREKFRGQPNSLDALAQRLGVNRIDRAYHGALRDSEILTEVYIMLTGGRETNFLDQEFGDATEAHSSPAHTADTLHSRVDVSALNQRRTQRPIRAALTANEEERRHHELLQKRLQGS